jgi:hypothetical protein
MESAGCELINWFGNAGTAGIAARNEIATPTVAVKKRNLLPLLTIVFLISYALMTTLIIEQGAAIQTQSNLIKVLLPESIELWNMKGKAIADRQAAKVKAQAHGQATTGQAQSGDSHAQPQSKTPANSPVHGKDAAKVAKPQTQFPPIPAADLDPRRTVHTI